LTGEWSNNSFKKEENGGRKIKSTFPDCIRKCVGYQPTLVKFAA
jgi:hypothetical protein